MESLIELQEAVLNYCKQQVNEVTFDCWFKETKLISLEGNEVTLGVSNKFTKDLIYKSYIGHFQNAFREILSFDVNITLVCNDEVVKPEPEKPATSKEGYEYTFDTFIIGSSNRFAHAACLAVAEKPAQMYNPLFIYGKSGLGKTHLLNAISAKIKKDYPEKVIVTVSCETFANEFIYLVHNEGIDNFREKYRNCDVFLLDDIQFIAGMKGTQEEFFNTFEALYNGKKQIVITSDRPPREIKTLTDRLRGRFESGLLTDIQPPEFETRVAILKRKAELLNINIPENVIYFIAEQVKSNIRQLEGVVKKLQAISNMQEKITIATAQFAIKDIRNDDKPEPVTVKRIIEEVARTYNVQPDDILGTKRDADISHARHIAIYVVHEITQMSLKKLGKEFNREHSSIVYANKQVKKLIETDEKEKNIISDIISNLQNEQE